ncbi:MAG TPA: hypothetical protein VEX68_28525 [Bryobacteraceae bacterium]|nr:hypothetical protein [Bryobacteraceae bacterium]
MNSQIASTNSVAAILARLFQVRQDNLSRGAAEYLLSIQFEDRDLARMHSLAQLAQSGDLSEDDRAELDSYLHVSNLLAVMQSKARRSLAALGVNRD